MMAREIKAAITADTMVPLNRRPGTEKPKAMEQMAPRLAPAETPSVDPSARGFFNKPCMQAPHRESAAPESEAHRIRGRRTGCRIR